MTWQDEGIIIHQAPFGESWLLVTMLTSHHGRFKGLCRSRKTPLLMGSQGEVIWRGRLEEHLGHFEMDQPYPHSLAMDYHQGALQCLYLLCMMCYSLLPERAPMPEVFKAVSQTLPLLPTPQGLQAYSRFETVLFEELGYSVSSKRGGLLENLQERQRVLTEHWPQLVGLYRARQAFLSSLIEVTREV